MLARLPRLQFRPLPATPSTGFGGGRRGGVALLGFVLAHPAVEFVGQPRRVRHVVEAGLFVAIGARRRGVHVAAGRRLRTEGDRSTIGAQQRSSGMPRKGAA